MGFFVALAALPILEIALFIVVGGVIGLWPTLLLILAGALAGAILLQRQGVRSLLEVQRAAARGEDPSAAVLSAALGVFGALLLIAPGFLSDAAGLALLAPPLREAAAAWAAPRMGRVVVVAGGARRAGPAGAPPSRPDATADRTIEVEYREVGGDADDRRL